MVWSGGGRERERPGIQNGHGHVSEHRECTSAWQQRAANEKKNVLINVEQIATENMTLEMHLLKIAEV